MIIRDILKLKGETIFSIGPEGKVFDAVGMMVKHDFGSLVVLDRGSFAGMLTFREVLKALGGSDGSLAGITVGDIMLKSPPCGSPEDSLESLRELMNKDHIRYLP